MLRLQGYKEHPTPNPTPYGFCKALACVSFGSFFLCLFSSFLHLHREASCRSRIRTVLFHPVHRVSRATLSKRGVAGLQRRATSRTPPLTCGPPESPRTRVLSWWC